MAKHAQISFKFEEWTLHEDSGPGWAAVIEFFKDFVAQNFKLVGWVYGFSPRESCYKYKYSIAEKGNNDLIAMLAESMESDSIVFIRFKSENSIQKLLKGYSKLDAGVIMDNKRSQVFPGLVQPGEWMAIQNDEIVLVIHHDGNPLFSLKANCNELTTAPSPKDWA